MTLEPYTDLHPDHVKWLNDPRLMKYSEQRHYLHTVETIAEYVDKSGYFRAIMVDGEFSGTVAAHFDVFNQSADLGIMVGFPGVGIGTEAWRLALTELAPHHSRITAGCMQANQAMIHIMDKTMKFDYIVTNKFLLDSEPTDGVYYYAETR